MKMRRMAAAVLLSAVGAGGAGCCPVQKMPDDSTIMAPRPAAAVIAALNHRAALINTGRVKGKVSIAWRDKDGKEQNKAGDGVLIFRKRVKPGAEEAPTYEAILIGQVLNQDIFEVGENETKIWMAQKAEDPKTARVLTKGPETDSEFGVGVVPLRAATVPFLLGIAPVRLSHRQTVVMTNPSSVELISLDAEGLPATALVLDRHAPGDPAATRMYRKDGIIIGEAKLLDYHTVNVAPPPADDDDEPLPKDAPPAAKAAGTMVRLPYRIEMVYPARKTVITFEVAPFASYDLNIPFTDASFKLPDFKKQGLKVEEGP